jgi:WD40 repeat protein
MGWGTRKLTTSTIVRTFQQVLFFRTSDSMTNNCQECISPSVMLSEHRLSILLDQVKRNQIASCIYHNTSTSPSLYQDHSCQPDHFPRYPTKELTAHTGEVWCVQFSHDGTRLASCGSDGATMIYNMETFEVIYALAGPEQGVCSLAWSPDDSMLVACQRDNFAVIWNTVVRGHIQISALCLQINRVATKEQLYLASENLSAVVSGHQMARHLSLGASTRSEICANGISEANLSMTGAEAQHTEYRI